jgi:hypothetical protein
MERLKLWGKEDPPVEFKFSMSDTGSPIPGFRSDTIINAVEKKRKLVRYGRTCYPPASDIESP